MVSSQKGEGSVYTWIADENVVTEEEGPPSRIIQICRNVGTMSQERRLAEGIIAWRCVAMRVSLCTRIRHGSVRNVAASRRQLFIGEQPKTK